MTEYDVARIGEDPDQLEGFYREHLRSVERFVARRVGDPNTAADLTADVFLAAIAASVDYRGDRGAPVVWLLGIARNVVASEHRRSGRERRAARRFSGRRLLDDESTTRIVERLDAERETRRIYSALANRRKPNDAGEWVTTDTSRYTVKAFKTLATKAGEQLHKGDQVIVAGSIVTEQWTDNETNQNRYRQTVLADAIGTSL